jgi:type II secretory pathway component PulC
LPAGREAASTGREAPLCLPAGKQGLPDLEGANLMRPNQKIILVVSFVTIFILTGIPLTGPIEVNSQPKRGRVLSLESRKDPFSFPSGIRLHSKEVHAPKDNKIPVAPEIKPVEVPLTLKAILITDHIRLASIDRSIVTVGDSINGEKLLEIKPDRVILGKEGKKRTLFLKQSPVKLTVEER